MFLVNVLLPFQCRSKTSNSEPVVLKEDRICRRVGTGSVPAEVVWSLLPIQYRAWQCLYCGSCCVTTLAQHYPDRAGLNTTAKGLLICKDLLI